jgi:SAM-dependent methyltransferase
MTERKVITAENRIQHAMESQKSVRDQTQTDPKWMSGTAFNLFYLDGMEYLQLETDAQLNAMAEEYNQRSRVEWPGENGDLLEYYRTRGKLQAARQVWYHGTRVGLHNDLTVLSLFSQGERFYGLDYGCGASLVGFELAMRGNQMDFIDVEGGGAYEFLKWRAAKRNLEHRCGWELAGPYDFILFMDALEHFLDPSAVVRELVQRLKPGGCVVTNYFYLDDHGNEEHISMDRVAVKEAFIDCGIYPTNLVVWVKQDLGFMDPGRIKLEEKTLKEVRQ